jgi:hypothetical protein
VQTWLFCLLQAAVFVDVCYATNGVLDKAVAWIEVKIAALAGAHRQRASDVAIEYRTSL